MHLIFVSSNDNNTITNYPKTGIMKSIATSAAYRLQLFIMAAVMCMVFSSCASDDDLTPPAPINGKITDARISFTYTVPKELLQYVEITACYNNNEGTDAKWETIVDPTFTVTYDINSFPITVPVVMLYTTRQSAYGVDVDWNITMDIAADLNIDGRREMRTHNTLHVINGDLGKGIDALMNNAHDRTFAVKISKSGDLQFVK